MTMAQFSRDDMLIYRGREEGRAARNMSRAGWLPVNLELMKAGYFSLI